MRVRAFTNRGSTTKVIGKFPSLKLGRCVWWESQLERDYILLLESGIHLLGAAGSVRSYREQPLRIPYVRDGRPHRYTPDILVETGDGDYLVEVKPESRKNSERNRALFASVAPVCREMGYEFRVVTDAEIRRQPRLDNVRLIWRYARTPIHPQHLLRCHELLGGGGSVALRELVALFDAEGLDGRSVYALLHRGALATDLMLPLGANASVHMPADALLPAERRPA